MTKAPDPLKAVADVAVGLPAPGTFHYSLPPELRASAQVGVRVQVPFGRRQVVTGFIVDLLDSSPRGELREVIDIPDPEPVFGAQQLPFYRFIAEYYFAPLGEVLRTALPSGLFKGSRPVYARTEAGAKAAKGPLLDEIDRRVLEALANGQELTIGALAERLGKEVRNELPRLVRWAFVEKRYRIAPLSAKRKYETVWRLPPKMPLADALALLPPRSTKREAIVRFLASHGGWANLEQIKSAVDDPRPTLNMLTAAGMIEGIDREVYRDIECPSLDAAFGDVEMTAEQRQAVAAIEAARTARRFEAFCLYGVTGSGKTEVYLRLAQSCLANGQTAIVLVPEISLTPQFLGRFVARLGPVVAPYHSRLSDGERYDQWRRMRRGEARVVVGARSALFAPFASVGLIVVDEEHEHSFKQEDGVMYHARDLALKLGAMHRCPVVLGSATPSLETYAAATAGRYRLLQLSMRPSGQPLPAVEIIDMRREMEVRRRERRPKGDADEEQRAAERRKTSERRVISRALAAALVETFQAGEQTILFLNRRGYATFAFCLECGEPLQCPRCEIALTYSDKRKELRCHYCDYATPEPATCPKCAGVNLFFGGMGTERLEDEVAKVVPGARLARMDRDTVRDRGDLYRILCAFAKGESDILLGTQMVAKGHDFPRVTLVGVVDADAALVLPDYRAAERAFSLVSQVAGRAGRADRPGRVLLQTFQPEHYAISTAARHDYAAFYAEEVARRSRLHYPPATRMAVLRITTPTAGLGVKACRLASQAAAAATDPADVAGAATIGPAPAMLHRLKGLHHWHLLVKAEKAAGLHKLCARILAFVHRERMPDGTYRLDVDPVSVM